MRERFSKTSPKITVDKLEYYFPLKWYNYHAVSTLKSEVRKMKKLFSAYKAKRMQKWLKKDPYSKVFLETPIYYILGVTLIYVICFILELTRKLKVKYPSVKFKYIDDLKSLLAKNPNYATLFYSNHRTNLDGMVLSYLMFRIGYKRCYKITKVEIFGWPILGYLAWIAGCRPIERGSNKGFANLKKLMQRGEVILIFPQGTFLKENGKMPVFKEGAALLAAYYDTILVPVKISGSVSLSTSTTYLLKMPELSNNLYDSKDRKSRIKLLKKLMASRIEVPDS